MLSDDTVLGFGNTSLNLGGPTDAEEYDRDVRGVLCQADDYQVKGATIDLDLTSREQGAVARPFIGFTNLAVLLLVGLTFGSYWVLAAVSFASLILLVWLKGISNLLGLKDDLVLSLIVPVAMISFGVDFAFHSVGQYREERTPRLAFGTRFHWRHDRRVESPATGPGHRCRGVSGKHHIRNRIDQPVWYRCGRGPQFGLPCYSA